MHYFLFLKKNCSILIIVDFFFLKKKKSNCRFMDGNSNSGAKNIGSIVSALASSTYYASH
jgi:hypothetical protein